ncbi:MULTISPECIES: dynamin family protein [unclassified Streptomyces]|uniref:dynamin family protein n=1 Tax=unclassified Streptomyces TaxID=2593676 RepID=UPI002E28912C|nr:dynamin family protein [Streptomyces sp. NBC_00223]
MSSAERHPLAPAVIQYVHRCADTVEQLGAAPRAEALRAEAAGAGLAPSAVVVVGEKKRGKSSLINALLERPDLLPVDADVATAVHLSVRYEAADSARALSDDRPGGVEIPLDRLAEYAAVDPETRGSLHPEVTGVAIGVPAALLEDGLTLIDTPGVGGLVSGHATITMATLARADALLFVVDGSSELTKSELAFLEEAARQVVTVVFVLTQIDTYPQWKSVLARNHALLARHAPAFSRAPWYPVSNRYRIDGIRARERGDQAWADELHARSGFRPLAKELGGDIVRRAERDRLAVVLDLAQAALGERDRALELREKELSAEAADDEQLRERQRALERLAAPEARWRRRLTTRVEAADHRLRGTVGRSLRDLRRTVETQVAEGGQELPQTVARTVRDGLDGLRLELENEVYRECGQLAAQLTEDCAVQGLEVLTPAPGLDSWRKEPLEGRVVGTEIDLSRVGERARKVMDALTRTPDNLPVPAAPTNWLDRITGRQSAPRTPAQMVWRALGEARTAYQAANRLTRVAVPLGLAAGVVALGATVWKVRTQQRTDIARHQARGEAVRLLESCADELMPMVTEMLRDVEADLVRQADGEIADRRDEVEHALTALRENRARRDAELVPERQEVRATREDVGGLLSEGRDLRRSLNE